MLFVNTKYLSREINKDDPRIKIDCMGIEIADSIVNK